MKKKKPLEEEVEEEVKVIAEPEISLSSTLTSSSSSSADSFIISQDAIPYTKKLLREMLLPLKEKSKKEREEIIDFEDHLANPSTLWLPKISK